MIIIVIAAIFGLYYLGQKGLLAIGYDDYAFYDDFEQPLGYIVKDNCLSAGHSNCWGGNPQSICTNVQSETDKFIFNSQSTQCVDGGSTRETIKDGALYFISTGEPRLPFIRTVEIKDDLSNANLKFKFKAKKEDDRCVKPSSYGVQIYIGETLVFTKTSSSACGLVEEDFTVEIYHSVVDENLVESNGEEYTLKSTDKEIKVIVSVYSGESTSATLKPAGTAQVWLYEVKYKVPYSCKIDDNSVLVFDDFNIDFSQDDLSYSPLRYCLDNPPILRSFEADGLMQDEKGEIFQKLVTGNTVSVKEGTTIRVPYITKYVEGQQLRCSINEAWNSKLKKCQIIVEQETPTAMLIACETDSDCWLPKNCEEITVECSSNKCIYSAETCQGVDTETVVVNEKLVYQEVIKEVENYQLLPVTVSESEFTYTFDNGNRELYIGDHKITMGEPTYNCRDSSTYRDDTCYVIAIDGKSAVYNQKIALNPYINAECYGKRINDYDSLKFKDDKWWVMCKYAFTADPMVINFESNPTFYKLNSGGIYRFKTKSSLYNFNNAGVFLDCERTTGVQQDLAMVRQPIQIKTEESSQGIALDVSETGKVSCELTQYLLVNADKQFLLRDNNKLKFSYIVGEKEPSATEKEALAEQMDILPDKCGLLCEIIRWFKSLFGG